MTALFSSPCLFFVQPLYGLCTAATSPTHQQILLLPCLKFSYIDTKLTSFQRQLNLYGFRRVTKGEDQGAYYHPKFQYGQGNAVSEIRRLPGNSSNRAHHDNHSSSYTRNNSHMSSSATRYGSRQNINFTRAGTNSNNSHRPSSFSGQNVPATAANSNSNVDNEYSSSYRPTHGHRTRGSVHNNYKNYNELENKFATDDDVGSGSVPSTVNASGNSGVRQDTSRVPWNCIPSMSNSDGDNINYQSSAVENARVTAPMYNNTITGTTSKMSNLSKRLGFGANLLRNTYNNGGYNDFSQNRPYNFNRNYQMNQMYPTPNMAMKRPLNEDNGYCEVSNPYKRHEVEQYRGQQPHATNISLSEMGNWDTNINSAGLAAELGISERAPSEVTVTDFDLGFFDFDEMNPSAPASQSDSVTSFQQDSALVADFKSEGATTGSI